MEYRLVPRVILQTYRDEERLEGLIRFCRRIGAEEVMLVTSGELHEPAWLPREEVSKRVAHTRNAVRRFRENGIEATLNIWRVIFPVNMYPENHTGVRQLALRADGSECALTPCPLDDHYRDYMRFFFGQMGETGAKKIFVDDDFGHWLIQGGPACFCPLHVAEFNRRHGTRLDRAAIALKMADPAERQFKLDWGALQADILVDLASLFAKSLHAVAPDARLGLMATSSELAAYAGRTRDVLAAFADGLPPLVRPGQGWYQDWDRTGLLKGLADIVSQRRYYPEHTEMISEIDSIPHTQFVKAKRVYFDYQIKANLAIGIGPQSVWCFSPDEKVDETHRYAETILRSEPAHRAVASAMPENPVFEGVQLLYSERARLLRSRPGVYGPEQPIVLWRLGIPPTFDDSPAAILTADSFPMPQDEIERLFSERNVLLDLGGVIGLHERGLGDLIGVEVERLLEGAERLGERTEAHPVNGDFAGRGLHFRVSGPVARFRPKAEGGTAVSHILDHTGSPTAPGSLLFEESGRRVAVLPYEIRNRNVFYSLYRKTFYRLLLEWLAGEPLPAFVEDTADVCPTVLRDPQGGRRVVSLLNCGYDPAEECALVIKKPFGATRVQFVADDGRIEDVPVGACRDEGEVMRLRLSDEMTVHPFDARFFLVDAAAAD